MDYQVIAHKDPEQEYLLPGNGEEPEHRYQHQQHERRQDQFPAEAAAEEGFYEVPDLGVAGRREPAATGSTDAPDGKLVQGHRQVRQIEPYRHQAGQQVVFAPFLRQIAKPQDSYRGRKEAAHVVVIGCQHAGQRKEQVVLPPGFRAKDKAIGSVEQQQAKEHTRNVHARIGAVEQEDKGHGHNSRCRKTRFVAEKAAAKAVNEPNGCHAAEQKGQFDGDLAVAEELDPIKEEQLHQGRVRVSQLHTIGDFVGKTAVNGAAEGAQLIMAELVLPQGNEAKGDP